MPLWRNVFAIALSTLAANCSSPNGSAPAEPAGASSSAAPVLRTANGQQTFGSGSAASSSSTEATSPGSTPAAPAASSEALQDPILLSPDAGTNGSVPPATQPSPSAAPQPSNAPSAQSDDDDDEEEDDD